MITQEQAGLSARRYTINESVIFREYLQLVLLQKPYPKNPSQGTLFKGGTAIHLIYQAPRFSGNLDFSVTLSAQGFHAYIQAVLKCMKVEEGVIYWGGKSVTGKQFLIAAPLQGRDLCDLWCLLSRGGRNLTRYIAKIAYYDVLEATNADIVKRILSFPRRILCWTCVPLSRRMNETACLNFSHSCKNKSGRY